MAQEWWGALSSPRLRAYLEEGVAYLIQKGGHTVCGREQLLQWCMEQVTDCPKASLLNALLEMLDEGRIVIGLWAEGRRERLDAPPDALAYRRVYDQECGVAHAVAQLMSECPCYDFDDDREAARVAIEARFATSGRASPDDVQWATICGLYNSSLSCLQGPAGSGKTEVVLRGLAEWLLLDGDSASTAQYEFDDESWTSCGPVRILAATPTHAAKRRLEESLGVRDAASCDHSAPLLHHSTVLRAWLCRWKPGWENCKLARDVLSDPPLSLALLVDESSMVDLGDWHALFEVLLGLRRRLPGLCLRCVLAGDHDQLPPVGVGAVFENLCTCGASPAFELTRVYRQEAESILRTAELYTDRCPTPYWTMKNSFVERVLEPNDPCVLLCKLEAADWMKGVPRPASAAATKVEDTGSKARQQALRALLAALQNVGSIMEDGGIPREKIQLVTFTNKVSK